MPTTPAETLYMVVGESKVFGADFQYHGPVKSGDTLDESTLTVTIDGSHTFDIEGEAVLDEDFLDAANGKKIPAGKGFKFRLSGGAAGEYIVRMSIRPVTSSEELMIIVGRLVVTT